MKGVGRFVPGATQNIPFVLIRFVPTPFLHVACHIVGSGATHAMMATDRRRAATLKVTERENVGTYQRINSHGSVIPMVNSRETLACILSIGRRLVPTHAADRIVVLSYWVTARFPRRRA